MNVIRKCVRFSPEKESIQAQFIRKNKLVIVHIFERPAKTITPEFNENMYMIEPVVQTVLKLLPATKISLI